MAGEELPPVVGVLEGDVSGWLDALDEAWGAYEAFAEKMSGQSVDLGGIAAPDMLATGEAMGAQLSEGITEGMAGLDVAPELAREMEAAGETGAEQLAAGLTAGVSGLGTELPQEIAEPLITGLGEAGAQAGAELDASLSASTSTLGVSVAQHIGEQLSTGLDEAAQTALGVLGGVGASGLVASAAGTGMLASLSANLTDAAAEVGGAAGDALMGALGDSAAQGGAKAAAVTAAGFEVPLSTAMQAAGESGAARYVEGLQEGISSISVPMGGLPLDQLLGQGANAPDAFVQDPNAPSRMVLQSVLAREQEAGQAIAAEAKAAADAARAALLDAFGSSDWQISGAQFAQLTDAGVAEWRAEVEAQAAAAGGAFSADFANGLRAQFADVDWATLTEAQVSALEDVLAASASAAGAGAGAALGEGLRTGIEATLAEDEAFLQAAMNAGMSEPLMNAVQDMRAGIEADVSSIPADLTGAFEGISARFAEAGTEAGTAYALALQDAMNAQAATLRPPTQVTGQPAYVDLTANMEQWQAIEGRVSGEAGAAAAGIGEVGTAATEATGAIGGMAGMMGGPLMWGIMGAATMLPMIAQGFNSSAITAATFTSSVQQDSGAVGDNTAATIQNALAKTDLNSMAQNLGVTQAQLIEYAAGEADAQNAVAEAYQRVDAYEQAHTSNAVAGLQAQKAQLDAVTASVAQAIDQERANTEALIAAEQTSQIYDATVGNLVTSMRQQAEQAKMSASAMDIYLTTVAPGSTGFADAVQNQTIALESNAHQAQIAELAALNLGNGQAGANIALAESIGIYNEATTGASAYGTALQATDGSIQNLLGSEASFTIALDGVTKAAAANGTSLDKNTLNGAQNVQVFDQVAQAADKAAAAVYQNDVNTGHASQAYEDANTKLEQEKNAFIAAADKANFNKQQVQALADELFKLPPDISVGANISPALSALNGLVQRIDSTTGAVQVYATAANPSGGKALSARASGGPVAGGEAYVVGEAGRPEIFVPGADGYITPMDMLTPSGYGASPAGGAFSYAAQDQPVVVNVYMDGQLVTSGVRTSSQQYKTRNALTGLT